MLRRLQPTAVLQGRDTALDGLRGLAVLLVFLLHYGGGLRAHNPALRFFGYVTQAGWMGVDLFFALSGFLITGLLADTLLAFSDLSPEPPRSSSSLLMGKGWTTMQRAALRNFFARRALRILPLYAVALLACAAAALLTGATLAQLKPLLLYATFLQNLPPWVNAALHTPPPLPVFHLWSLAVEEQFYVLWPFALLAAQTPRRALHLSLYVFAASCLFRAVVFMPHMLSWATASSFAVFLPTRAGALALGSALALDRVVRSDSTAERRSQRPILLAGILAVAVMLLTAVPTHTFLLSSRTSFLFTLPAADVLSAGLVALALCPNRFRSVLSTGPLDFLGRISYGFYVFHILFEPFFDNLGTVLTRAHSGFAYQAARLICALPLTVAAAWLSFTFLETPFLRRKKNFPRLPAGTI